MSYEHITVQEIPNISLRTAAAIEQEIARAKAKHPGDFHNHHEAYAVLKEEVDEYWDDVKHDRNNDVKIKELVQIAAMAIRTINELCYEQQNSVQ